MYRSRRQLLVVCLAAWLIPTTGCALTAHQSDFFSPNQPVLPSSAQNIFSVSLQIEEEKANGNSKRPRALMEWSPFKTDEQEDDSQPEPMQADRPDFTESSNTVGLGRIQLESGYTFTRDRQNGVTTRTHSYPEVNLRIGMFAEWFELRIQQNYLHEIAGGATTHGLDDLSLGCKFFLAEQQKWLPEHSLVLQMRVPTGRDGLTNGEVLPGIAYWFGWDVIKDKIDMAGGFVANRAREDSGHFYTEIAQTMVIGYTLTHRLGAYTEWFATYPSGAVDGETGPEHYFDAGLTYFITPEFRLDIRAGLGLNRHADDFFAGSGFVVRY